MSGRYRLEKLGKAYILFCGDKKMTIPASVHNNGVIELHDTIVSTEDGEAFEIKEHSNGQITFEEIPTVGVSKVQSTGGPTPRTKMESGASNRTNHRGEPETGSDEVLSQSLNPSTKTIRLGLITHTGTQYSVSLRQDSSVEQLFQMASIVSKIPADQIRLLFGGKQLESTDFRKNTLVLADYNILDGCRVMVELRLRGD